METTVTESSSPVRETYIRESANPTVIVADGYGLKIHVVRGHLVIEDGIGRTRRTRRIPRVDARSQQPPGASQDWGVARLVILGSTGYVSLEAFRWCADLGVQIMHADRDGRLMMASPGQSGDARIREAQVHAQPNGHLSSMGMRIVKDIMSVKLSGQAEIASGVLNSAKHADRINIQLKRMLNSERLADMLSAEGTAANAYWDSWKNRVFVPFNPSDLKLVPAHWYGFNGRVSSVMKSPRHASDPVNAMLNYAYKICESEALLACHTSGLEPMWGFSHEHSKAELGMVFDLMEALRPDSDRAVLSMLDHSAGIPMGDNGRPLYFDVLWFCETKDGTCRLVAPLAHMIAERVIAAVARKAQDLAERIVRELAHASVYDAKPVRIADKRIPVPSPVPARVKLDGALTSIDLVPDELWETVRPLIPPEPVVRTHKPNPRVSDRAALAGILCHEIHRVPWSGIPPALGVDRKTCRRRLDEWSRLGAWPAIFAAVTGYKHAGS